MENLDVNIKESLKNATKGDLEELSSNGAVWIMKSKLMKILCDLIIKYWTYLWYFTN